MGKIVFTIIAAVVERERSIIRERVLAGVDRARRQGKRFGRPTVIIDREKVAPMKAAGRSIKAIVTECRISRATVRRTLAKVAESGRGPAAVSA
jgi:DNA invertase Pin-like site-specific DNA recombinase